MNARQARQIRGAITIARNDYAHVQTWLAIQRRTPLELQSLLHAHYRLIRNHYRRQHKETA